MRLLTLSPPRKPKNHIPNNKPRHTHANLNNSPHKTITQNLRVSYQEPAISLVKIQGCRSCPFAPYSDLVGFRDGGRDRDEYEWRSRGDGGDGFVGWLRHVDRGTRGVRLRGGGEVEVG